MAVAYRSSQSVTNGTAGTSVTVSKPAGIVDTGSNPSRDQLIALIGTVGAPSISAPAGWTLVTSIASSTNVTLAAYRKLASSEGASWTWTLGASQRNWGWVGAYTGVDPTTPVADFATTSTLTSSTILSPDAPDFAMMGIGGEGVGAAAAVRTATGSATTWTMTSTERADLSTNAGSGTDISGEVGDSVNPYELSLAYLPTMTASQNQSAGVAIALTLTGYFTPYTGSALTLKLEAAQGADPDGDLSVVSWTDYSAYVLENSAVRLVAGRSDGTSTAQPFRMNFTLKDINGEFTKPTGTFTPYFVRNLPLRLRITGIGSAPNGYHRATAFMSSAKVRWDASLKVAVIDVEAQGRLRRMQRNTQPLHSAGYRSLLNPSSGDSVKAIEHWSFEDGSDATTIASSLDGHSPASLTGSSLASSTLFPGSDALPVLSAASGMTAAVQSYTDTDNMWWVAFATSLPQEPAAAVTLLQVATTGTAATWKVGISPGTSALTLNVTDSAGTSLLSTSVAFTEADVYGQPTVVFLSAIKNGTGVDYDAEIFTLHSGGVTGTGITGTITSSTQGIVTGFSFLPQSDLAGATFGQLALYKNDPGFLPSTYADVTIVPALLLAHAGEFPYERVRRLCLEEGVQYTVGPSESTVLTMGPQGIDTLVGLLRDCETVEGCLMHDSGVDVLVGTGLLEFPARDARDNATSAMTLDFDLHEVTTAFEPTLDDLSVVNDAEASRPTGASRRVIDQTSIDTEGRIRTQVQANTGTDSVLADIAGRLVGLGTVPGMRFAQVGWNLRLSTELAEDWLAVRLSNKLTMANPPSQYPPDDVDVFLEGYTETLATYRWDVLANLSPAVANAVMELADTSGDTSALAGHLDADSCVLAEDLDTTETGVDVTTTPLVTTTADDFPFDIYVGRGSALERMTVTNCTGSSNPQTLTVTRSVNGVVMTHTTGDAVTLIPVLRWAM